MDVKVAGHWEIGYMTPIMEANYWNLILREFEIQDWHMIPVTGIHHNEQSLINLTEHPSYDELFQTLPDHLPRVFLEPRSAQTPNTTWLHQFSHPNDCIYIFGSAHYNPTISHFRPALDHIVSIKTMKDIGVPWADQCLFVVLYDRYIKTMP